MPIFKITKRIRNSHVHVVYLRDDGTGIASPAPDGHVPNVVFMATDDPETAGWMVQDPNGTIHSLEDVPVSVNVDDKDEKNVVQNVLRDYVECFNYERASRAAANESERMYAHEQWAAGDKPSDPKRAAATINVIEDKVDTLVGYQRQNRTDIHYLPSEKGDAFGADVLNILTKKILNLCYYQREKSKVFDDESIVGRGLFNVVEDYEKNVEGNIVVERFPWDECYFGPHEKEDLSDCEVMFKAKWYTEDKIKALYPEKFDGTGGEAKTVEIPTDLVLNEDGGLNTAEYELIDANAKKFRLLERWRKEYRSVELLIYADDSFVFKPEGWDRVNVDMAKKIPGVTTIKREAYRMRRTRTVSTIRLEDEYTKEMDYDVIPVYAKFRKGKWWGKVEGVKDLQMLINKSYSQFIDLIAQIRTGTTYYDAETFPNKTAKDDYLLKGTTPGHVQEVTDVSKPPHRDEGIKFPSELVTAIQMFQQSLREIMNVNLSFQGLQNEQQSGVAMRQHIIQQLIGNDFLFDNMSFAEQILAKKLIKKIQKLYTPERILRVLSHENKQEKKRNAEGRGLQIDGKPMDDYPEEELLKLLKTTDFAEMDVDVGEAPNAPSAMMGAFLMCLEATRAGAPIPPDIFINLYPMPELLKQQILQSLQAVQQAQAQAEDKKYSTEIEKTKIAHGDTGAPPMAQQQTGTYGVQL